MSGNFLKIFSDWLESEQKAEIRIFQDEKTQIPENPEPGINTFRDDVSPY